MQTEPGLQHSIRGTPSRPGPLIASRYRTSRPPPVGDRTRDLSEARIATRDINRRPKIWNVGWRSQSLEMASGKPTCGRAANWAPRRFDRQRTLALHD